MSIQSNINQTLSLAGFLYSQTPAYQQQAKITGLQKEQKTLQQRKKVAVEKEGGSPAAVADLEEKMAKVQHDIYKTKPSVAAYEAYEKQAGVAAASKKGAIKQANKEMEEEAEAEYVAGLQEAYDKGEFEVVAGTEITTPKAPEIRDEASETIRQEILSPYSIAEEHLRKAIEAKRESIRRKGGRSI